LRPHPEDGQGSYHEVGRQCGFTLDAWCNVAVRGIAGLMPYRYIDLISLHVLGSVSVGPLQIM
jgi:hypothetical protein